MEQPRRARRRPTRPRRLPTGRVLVVLAGLVAAMAVVGVASPAGAEDTCPDAEVTRWVGASNGTWGDPTRWSDGVPDADTHACIDLPGTYTVTVPPGANPARSLTILATGATVSLLAQGTPTVIDVALEVAEDVVNGGTITSTSNAGGAGATTVLVGGTMTNLPGGAITTGTFGSGRTVQATALDNQGSITLTNGKTLTVRADALDTNGAISIQQGTTLRVEPRPAGPGPVVTTTGTITGNAPAITPLRYVQTAGTFAAPDGTIGLGLNLLGVATIDLGVGLTVTDAPPVEARDAAVALGTTSPLTLRLRGGSTLVGDVAVGQILEVRAVAIASSTDGPITDTEVATPGSLTNAGTITFSSNSGSSGASTLSVGGTLTNLAGATIPSGVFGGLRTIEAEELVNQGAISLTNLLSMTLRVDALANAAGASVTTSSTGPLTVVAREGGAGPEVTFAAGSVLSVGGSRFEQTGGTLTTAPGVVQGGTNGLLRLTDVGLAAAGTVAPSLQLLGASVLSPGASPGVLEVGGSYTQGPDATLVIDVAGPTPGDEHDVLSVGGTATLGGTLAIERQPGYAPGASDALTIVTGGALGAGTFSTVTGAALPGGGAIVPRYAPGIPGAVTLTGPDTVSFTARFDATWGARVDNFASGMGITPAELVAVGVGALRTVAEEGQAVPAEAGRFPNDGDHLVTVAWPTEELGAIEAAAAAWGVEPGSLHEAAGQLVVIVVYRALVAAGSAS